MNGKKLILVINLLVLIGIILFLIFFVWKFSVNEEIIISEECVDVHSVASFYYDVCYDNSSKNIYVELKRSFDIYRLKKIRFSFFDYSDKIFDVIDVPNTNESKAYKIFAEKNPQNLDIFLEVVKDFSSPICEEPRKVFVRDCPFNIGSDFLNVSMVPFNQVPLSNYSSIGEPRAPSRDSLSSDLVEKERIWKSICESKWDCGAWEECVDGIQKRKCVDTSGCVVQTNSPETMRFCDGRCVENWACEWSECREGYTVPNCRDLNNCGTNYNVPQMLQCKTSKVCTPEISCGEWSECEVEYNFLDLISKDIKELKGIKQRTCLDKNSCAAPIDENRECVIQVDIYTRTFNKCGIEYVGIYNRLNNELIARIDKNTGAEPHLNVYLDDKEDSLYCDYCFDGVKNGDELGLDCGGSCKPCEEKYARVEYKRENALTRFWDWIMDLF